MSTPANSINEPTTGIVGMTGTGFTASPTTPFLVQIGGTNSYELDEVAIGTAGQVLTSNGPGVAPTFQAAGGGDLLIATGQITSLQIKALNATPYVAIAAPGAGNFINVIKLSLSFVYGGSNVFVASAAQTINAIYGPPSADIGAFIANTTIIGSTDRVVASSVIISGQVTANYTNRTFGFYNPVATEISGNAANDNVVNWTVIYHIDTV